jgi:hypothetical protein
MSKKKFDHGVFQEEGNGNATDVVGSKKIFNNAQEFIDFIYNEYDYVFEDVEKPTVDKIKTDYIRYYPKMPEEFEIESGYTFCKKGRGAIEVYRLELN